MEVVVNIAVVADLKDKGKRPTLSGVVADWTRRLSPVSRKN